MQEVEDVNPQHCSGDMGCRVLLPPPPSSEDATSLSSLALTIGAYSIFKQKRTGFVEKISKYVFISNAGGRRHEFPTLFR